MELADLFGWPLVGSVAGVLLSLLCNRVIQRREEAERERLRAEEEERLYRRKGRGNGKAFPPP